MITSTTPFVKSITASFEVRGKRKKLVGFVGALRDESGAVLSAQLYDTKPAAEQALDALAHELLIDYAARGLVDTLPALDPPGDNPMGDSEGDPEPPDRPRAMRLAQALANTIQSPVYVVNQGDRYLIQDDDDLRVYCASTDPAAIVARFQPAPPRAQTLQSIQIEQTMRRCHNCGADHRTWQCPAIAQRLFVSDATPWADADLGRELCRMKWRNFTGFVTLLLSVPPAHVLSYAASYQAFIRTYRPDSDLTINDVLRVWTNDMRRARQVAA